MGNSTLHFHFKLESYGIFHQLKPFGFSLVTSAFHFMPAYASSPTEMKGWAMNGSTGLRPLMAASR